MMVEIIILIATLLMLVLLYAGRMKSVDTGTFLFSDNFLMRADERIFEIVKFVFKKYKLIQSKTSSFVQAIPHTLLNIVHKIAHMVTLKSSSWVDKIKSKSHNDTR